MRWFISIRYLLTHLRQSLVCIAGVTISVMMFITMTAMMNGFTDKFIIETVESSGHITIHDEPRETRTPILERFYKSPNAVLVVQGVKPRDKIEKIKNPEGLLATLRRMPGITAVAPQVSGDVIATYGTKTMSLAVMGVDPDQTTRVTTIGTKVTDGDFARLKTAADGVVIGSGVSSVLGAKVDDIVTLSSPTGGLTTAKVVGIFSTGVTPVDYSRAYMLINDAQTLLDKRNIINEITLRTDDYTRAEEYAAQIESMSGYKTESWQESNANFLKIFRIQTIITYFITAALLVVAAFGVLNILIMAVLERVNDIAILKSFGLSRGDITQVYVFQGLVIGLIGATVGLVLGKLAVEGLRRIPIQMEGLVKAEGLLMSEHLSNYVTAFVAAIIVTLIAAVYPARRAAKYDPVEVIRGGALMGDDDDKLQRGTDGWETAVAIDYFRGSGENFDAISADWAARQHEAAARAAAKPDPFARSLPWPTRIVYRVGRWLFQRWWNSPNEQAEEEALFSQGKFKLVYAAKESKTPSRKQRDAWDQIVARGDAAWDELMSLMIAEYRRQYPIRTRWWRAIHGDYLLDRALPDVADAAGMKKLLRPIEFRVKRVKKDAAAADVAVWFMATWNTDGVVGLMRDGRAVEVGPIDLIVPMKKRPKPALHHPVLGPLRRIPDDDPYEVIDKMNPSKPHAGAAARGPYPWEGTMRCEPLRDYFLAADDRASFKFDPAHAEQPQSAMPWDFAQGNFDLRVYAPPGREPTDAQANAFKAFKAAEARHAAAIVAAVFDHYTKNFDKHRSLWRAENLNSPIDSLAARAVQCVMGGGGQRNPGFIEEIIPKLVSPDGLHDRMWLKHVHVHPADENDAVTIAFQFLCTWIGEGFTVHWRDGKVEKVGRWKTAEPTATKKGAAS